ncbi:MAG: hypothetical protein M3Y17_02155 [Actinomycetota bacterium]|nr:hypothetical protein [Actinomycetota bacterium]
MLALTLIALQAAGRTCAVLEPVRDLDAPADAKHIAADARGLAVGRVLGFARRSSARID